MFLKIVIGFQYLSTRDAYQIVLNEADTSPHLVAVKDVGIATILDRAVHLKSGALPIQVNIQDGAKVTDPNLPLIGRVEPGSFLSIKRRLVPVNAVGDFQIKTPLMNGQYVLSFEARDQAGNTTRLVRMVNYSHVGTDGLTCLSRNMEQLPS